MNTLTFKLETTFKDLDLGKNFTAAKKSLISLKEKIEELKGFNKDGLFIHEYFSKLRNEIDIEREVVKLKIDEHYLKLIAEVDEIEDKCMSVSTDTNKLIVVEVKTFEEVLENFQIDFDKLEIDFYNWENIRKGSNRHLKELNEMIPKFKNDLLLKQLYSFESDLTLFDDANEASIIISKESIIEKGTF